jgi:hypothetical protein
MARSVIQSSEDEVHFGTHGQEGKALPDHESESPVGSPDRLEPLVDAPGKGRRDTLLELADEEGTDVTWEEFRSLIKKNPEQLHQEIVEVIQSLRDLNIRHQELRTQYKKNKTESLKQEAMIEGLLLRQSRQCTLSDVPTTQRTAKIKDLLLFSGKCENGTLFDDWLVQVKNKLRGNKDWYNTAELRLIYVSELLKGDALALTSTRTNLDHP